MMRRMERRGLITASWGVSQNNRRAKFYELTADGERQLEQRTRDWESHATAVTRALASTVPAAT